MRRVLFIIVGILLFCSSAISQVKTEGYISLSGRVLDASTGKVLDFASINLKNTAIGIVTNSEGFFQFKIPTKAVSDSVTVSFLGYRTITLSVDDFKQDRVLDIKLLPISYRLDPVIVTSYNPLFIVKSALEKVEENYQINTVNMTAFYREKIRKRGGYILVNEAVLSINKAPYNSYRKDVIEINKARGNYDEQRIDTLIIKFRGGAYSALEIDVAKNAFMGVEPSLIGHYYDFSISEPESINDRTFIVVNFDQKPYLNERFYRGKIYIDPKSKALARAEFAMNVEGVDSAYRFFVKSKPSRLNMEIVSANYLVNYKELNGKWYFDYSKTDLTIKTKWKRDWFSNTFVISSEMAITDISFAVPKIESENRLRVADIISDKVKDYADLNFWGNYNIIEPDADINKIINRIIKQLKKRE